MIIHIVTAGESLSQLAAEYGVDIRNLAADNGISTNDSLVVGQALLVQIPEVVHTVQRGETLTSIAAAYGITAVALLETIFGLRVHRGLSRVTELLFRMVNNRRRARFRQTAMRIRM